MFSGVASITWGYDDSSYRIVVKERQSRIFRAHLPCRKIFLHVVFAKQPFEDVIIDIPAAFGQRRARSIGPVELFGELFPWILFEIVTDRTEEKGQREPSLRTGDILKDFFNAIPTETRSNARTQEPWSYANASRSAPPHLPFEMAGTAPRAFFPRPVQGRSENTRHPASPATSNIRPAWHSMHSSRICSVSFNFTLAAERHFRIQFCEAAQGYILI